MPRMEESVTTSNRMQKMTPTFGNSPSSVFYGKFINNESEVGRDQSEKV